MRENHLWNRAKKIIIQTGPEITGGFSVGFDKQIPEKTKDALMDFVYWVEDNFSVPVTLWVDFKYRHYLQLPDGGRVGYKFYWADFETYPVFDAWDDIPVIELPVRTENWTIEDILFSFIQGITDYYLWLTNDLGALLDVEDAEEILQAYLQALHAT